MGTSIAAFVTILLIVTALSVSLVIVRKKRGKRKMDKKQPSLHLPTPSEKQPSLHLPMPSEPEYQDLQPVPEELQTEGNAAYSIPSVTCNFPAQKLPNQQEIMWNEAYGIRQGFHLTKEQDIELLSKAGITTPYSHKYILQA